MRHPIPGSTSLGTHSNGLGAVRMAAGDSWIERLNRFSSVNVICDRLFARCAPRLLEFRELARLNVP